MKQFKDSIKEQTQRICIEENRDWHTEYHRGYAFQVWVAELISNFEQSFDTEPEEAVLSTKDLNADIVFEDSVNKHLLICQCKFSSISKLKTINEDELVSFFRRHSHFMDRNWVENNGSQEAIILLADYSEKIRDGYKVTYRFVTTAETNIRLDGVCDKINREFEDSDFNISCELFDFTRLKEYYVKSQTIEESIPQRVSIPLNPRRYFEKEIPFKTVIAVLNGNVLKSLYKRYKESLFAYNIRNYLGNRGINSAIKKTATEEPEKFFYLNNGVSAICTEYEVTNNVLEAKNFQIINGAQTVGSIARSPFNRELEILFRVTMAESVKTDKGFNQDIIKSNNSQNTIKLSDFRANDHIQKWLENRFKTQKPTKVLPNIRYSRKRSYKRQRGTISIKLEELAKIRFSFFYEPTKCLSQPKALWTLYEEGGVYEKSFGINGEIVSEWSEGDFQDILLGIGIYTKYVNIVKNMGKSNPEIKYLNRLKWHAVSLCGIYIRTAHKDINSKNLIKNENLFNSFWKDYWDLAFDAMDDVFGDAMEENTSLFAFVRSTEKWNKMKKKFQRKIMKREFELKNIDNKN